MSKEFFIGRKGDSIYQYRQLTVNWLYAWWIERKLKKLEAADRERIKRGHENVV